MRAAKLAVWLALSTGAFSAAAQAPGDGAVTGVGTVTLKRTPDTLRIQLGLTGEGKTLKEALAKLQQRRESAKKKLATLGATEASIQFEDTKVDGADPRQQQMERMMRQRMRSPNRPATGPAAQPPVRVGVNVKAEWPLTSASPEELLISSHELQTKIKAADLAETKTSSLEEQEAREEAAGGDPDQQSTPPGEPSFVFVSKISDADRAKATAEAFAKAKTSAAELAKAAAAELGALKQLTSQVAPDMEQMQYLQYQRYRGLMPTDTPGDSQNEAVGLQPTAVVLRIAVSASFSLK